MKALHFVGINYLQTNIRLFSFGDLSGFVTHTTVIIFRIFRLDACYNCQGGVRISARFVTLSF